MNGLRRGPADHSAVVLAGTGMSLTHTELEDRSRRLAAGLLAAGLRSGDVVALLGNSNLAAYEVLQAVEHAGLTLAALDHTMGLEELAYVVNDSEASAVFFGPGTATFAGALGPLTPGVRLRLSLDGSVDSCLDHAQLLAEPPIEDAPERAGAQLRYSSGGRGRPRRSAVVRPTRAGTAGVQAALAPYYTITSETVLLTGSTLADPIGWQLTATVLREGGTVITLEDGDAEAVLAAISRHRVTLVSLPPPSLVAILRVPEATRHSFDVTTVSAVVHSCVRLPMVAKRRLIEWLGPVVHEFYGSAEVGALTFISAPEWLERPGSVGQSLQGQAYAAVPGGALPPGEVGVVTFGLPPVPSPRGAKAIAWPGTPVTLGDRGRVDEQGYVHLVGAHEVEELLCLYPKVADVAALPGPWLSDVVLVQPAQGVVASVALERELLAYLRPRVSAPEALVGLQFASRIPRTVTGGLATGRMGARIELSDRSLA